MKQSVIPQPDAGARFSEPPGYFNKQQVAHHLCVSTRTIDALMAAHKLPFIKLTRKLVRFRRQDVDDYLARNFRVNAVGE